MNVGLHDSDGRNRKKTFPNLALMKLAAWHRSQGDSVEWFIPLFSGLYDVVYSSKVFTWTDEDVSLPGNTKRGGTGYRIQGGLPDHIEHICPDYSLYGQDYSMGFLTRGCVRSCSWCIVPEKEGPIRAHADVEEFARHRDVVLMDNNVLAHDHGIAQIEKMARLGLRVDFNQGLDARLIDASIAKRLAALRWRHPIRLACDHKGQMSIVERAVKTLRSAGATPKAYSCYVLIKDVPDALERILFLQGMGVDPFAQPYRDFSGTEPMQEQKDLARWCNMAAIRKTVPFEDYRPRKAEYASVQ